MRRQEYVSHSLWSGRFASPSLMWLALVIFAMLPSHSLAEKRVALVIGNGNYSHAAALANPTNDAALVTTALEAVGFSVVSVMDGDHALMLQSLSKFGRMAENADIALFYYAGHGLQVAGKNWLLPVSANIESSTDLPASAVSANSVLELMELSGARARIAILDACRNNPLARSLTRATTRGLAKIESSAAGTMIVFATAPGQVALDGTGNNSPFSKALSQQILVPGLEVRQMIGRVRRDVMEDTGDKQVPWVNEAIVGDIYLSSKPDRDDSGTNQLSQITPLANLAAQQSANNTSQEIAFWNSVKDSEDAAVMNLYVKQYPNGVFVEIAKIKMENLANKNQQQTASQQNQNNRRPILSQQLASNNRLLDLERDMEYGARQLVNELHKLSSAQANDYLRGLQRFYADYVQFYKKDFSLANIRKDKKNYVKRWPSRDFRPREDSFQIFCDTDNSRCRIDAIVDWRVSSRKRNSSISGASTMHYEIRFSQTGPKIVSEAGDILFRNKN